MASIPQAIPPDLIYQRGGGMAAADEKAYHAGYPAAADEKAHSASRPAEIDSKEFPPRIVHFDPNNNFSRLPVDVYTHLKQFLTLKENVKMRECSITNRAFAGNEDAWRKNNEAEDKRLRALSIRYVRARENHKNSIVMETFLEVFNAMHQRMSTCSGFFVSIINCSNRCCAVISRLFRLLCPCLRKEIEAQNALKNKLEAIKPVLVPIPAYLSFKALAQRRFSFRGVLASLYTTSKCCRAFLKLFPSIRREVQELRALSQQLQKELQIHEDNYNNFKTLETEYHEANWRVLAVATSPVHYFGGDKRYVELPKIESIAKLERAMIPRETSTPKTEYRLLRVACSGCFVIIKKAPTCNDQVVYLASVHDPVLGSKLHMPDPYSGNRTAQHPPYTTPVNPESLEKFKRFMYELLRHMDREKITHFNALGPIPEPIVQLLT